LRFIIFNGQFFLIILVSLEPYFDYVPDELVQHIFNFLPSIQELGRVSAVNTRFNNFASQNKLWEPFFRKHSSKKLIPEIPVKSQYMDSIFQVRRVKVAQNFMKSMQSKLNTESTMKTVQLHFQIKINEEIINLTKRSLFSFPLFSTVVCTDPTFVTMAAEPQKGFFGDFRY
jgi:hypothetical protein